MSPAMMARQRRDSLRGFTIVELLVVVAMIGVLAALALVGYRKYLHSAQSSEAAAVTQGIRAAQEAYKAEMLVYLSASGNGAACAGAGSLTSYYPQTLKKPDKQKWNWVNPAHTDVACWRILNVTTDGPVRFGYAVVAGLAGTVPPAPSTVSKPVWGTPTEPWYVIQAAGDRDGDGTYAYFLASSFRGEIYSEKDTE